MEENNIIATGTKLLYVNVFEIYAAKINNVEISCYLYISKLSSTCRCYSRIIP